MRPLAPSGALLALSVVTLVVNSAAADSTSGIDGALFRSSYDSNGLFSLEGARLLPLHDLSLKVLAGYGTSPISVAVPGIGSAAGDTSDDRVLDRLFTLDLAFGMTVARRFAIGFTVGAYRTSTGAGYGTRGRYMSGNRTTPSTGLIALRPLSNIDPSADSDDSSSYLGDGLAGPLDVRLGGKLALVTRDRVAATFIGSVFLPFGEDEMLLGDRNLVFEPKLAVEYRGATRRRPSTLALSRVVANVGARIRRRTVLESFDAQDAMATDLDSQVFLDVGSELVLGLGATKDASSRLSFGAELQLFVPLPDALSIGSCRRFDGSRCSTIKNADYFADAKRGDLVALVQAGASIRVTTDVALQLAIGSTPIGVRGDELRFATGLTWAPQPAGSSMPTKRDKDGDGIPDSLDACPSEPEDKDGNQDEDGCADPDNDRDGLLDGDDKCANEAEDKDGFEDSDGCPERDNDKDGNPDVTDHCPDQAEDLDNFEDDDGCPDPDNDGDGITDDKDQCPNDRGPKTSDGCPERGRP